MCEYSPGQGQEEGSEGKVCLREEIKSGYSCDAGCSLSLTGQSSVKGNTLGNESPFKGLSCPPLSLWHRLPGKGHLARRHSMSTVGSVPGNRAGCGEAVQALSTHYTSLWGQTKTASIVLALECGQKQLLWAQHPD